MEQIKKIFPLSTSCTDRDTFIKNVIIYFVAAIVCWLVFTLLGRIPLIGAVLGIIGWIIDVYLGLGIILAVLIYFNIVK